MLNTIKKYTMKKYQHKQGKGRSRECRQGESPSAQPEKVIKIGGFKNGKYLYFNSIK